MSYQANVYNVMIASPSDVAKERQLIQETIHEWNHVHSLNKKIILLPICWETHSTPEMGDRAQTIVNKQILENADLLVGVFWTRIGTPTGESISGTVEEIERHISADKPAMIYFSGAPVYQDSIDHKQYEELKKFKTECKSRGLIKTYESLSDFKAQFSKQLAIKINQSDYFEKNAPQEESPSDAKLTVAYDNTLTSQIPALSEKARLLLIEASKDPNGHILKLRFIGTALIIQTNKQTFTGDKNPRENAAWESAIEELCNNGFLQERGDKGEIFALTNTGYQMADYLLKQEQS